MEKINWKEIPEIITKEQFYKLCGISKKTALFLLQSGKVPCINTGKKTRCYKIRKKDVKAYLREREAWPEIYKPVHGWYYEGYKSKRAVERLPDIDPELLKYLPAYYTEILKDEPDVLTATDIHTITGYAVESVNKWIGRGHLKAFHRGQKNLIPKVFLIEFLCSIPFRTIQRKTSWHVHSIQHFPLWVQCKTLRDAESESQGESTS